MGGKKTGFSARDQKAAFVCFHGLFDMNANPPGNHQRASEGTPLTWQLGRLCICVPLPFFLWTGHHLTKSVVSCFSNVFLELSVNLNGLIIINVCKFNNRNLTQRLKCLLIVIPQPRIYITPPPTSTKGDLFANLQRNEQSVIFIVV